ncbi:putative iron-sulfur cluster assembly accessory protein Isa1 [Delphinella strobiligena]|nr:putative iron-sulfur cluster assembly accessory protein Isa1 [Delphinella strobiligena]
MSLPRTTTSAAFSMFRFAAGPSAATRQCQRCLRPFSSSHMLSQSRRQLQTEAYRPRTLDASWPSPRNAGIPDTSIAGTVSKVDQSISQQPQPLNNQAPVSLPESVAQTSSKANTEPFTPSTASPSPAPAKPRTRKLRPRKAAMTISSTAVEQLRGLLDQPEPKLIRVGVKNRGCSGLAYNLEYVDKAGAFDETVEQDGVRVLIDSKALFSIIGSEMDWIEDKLNQRFIFKNPNITEQCGCGESFSIS